MLNRFKLLIFSLFVIYSLVLVPSAIAQSPSPTETPDYFGSATCPPDEILTDLGCVPQDPIGFVERFYGIGLGLIGMVALLFMIFGGYFIMTSQGNPTRLAIGKQYVFYSIAGLILAIMGFIFIQIIAGDILRIPGFN